MTKPLRLSTMGGGGPATYIEDVFSTYLYTGNGSTQTITNGIDLAGKGGLVWAKDRQQATDHQLSDSAIGPTRSLSSSSTLGAGNPGSTDITGFTSSGFSLGYIDGRANSPSNRIVSWTFRKQPKFFDVVTYTGNGTNTQTVSHNLGAMPGFIVVKATSTTGEWYVCCRYTDTNYFGSNGSYNFALSTTSLAGAGVSPTNREITSTTFNPGRLAGNVAGGFEPSKTNANGVTYVAYLFAHNAGGFGATGNDSVISCGAYTGNGSTNGTVVNLGWEPQWILIKRTDINQYWNIWDAIRGIHVGTVADPYLAPNVSDTENSGANYLEVNANGFQLTSTSSIVNELGGDYIYMAIRRPMKTPTSGTEVYKPIAFTGTGTANTDLNFGFPVDMWLHIGRYGAAKSVLAGYEWPIFTRMLSVTNALNTTLLNAWGGGWGTSYLRLDNNYGVRLTTDNYFLNYSGGEYSTHGFKRAPGFMDIVCYTGTGSARTVSHGLGVTPELMIVKRRDSTGAWCVYHQSPGNTKVTFFDTAATINGFGYWNNTSPTSSVFTVNTNADVNASGGTYIAYLFASCPGVSKVGTYTGNGGSLGSAGGSQTINCGFTSGARFVLIRKTNRADHWYLFDTGKGIFSGNDPYMRLNATNAEGGGTDEIDPDSSGFIVNQTATLDLNVTGDTYIYLAIS